MKTGAAAVAALICVVGLPASMAAGQVAWKNAEAPAMRVGAAESVSAQARRALGDAAERRVVVRLSETPTAEARARFARSGVRLLAPLGDGAYFATVRRDTARVDGVLERLGVVDAEEIRAEWKLHPALARGGAPEHAVILGEGGQERAVAGYVVFHADADLEASSRALIDGFGVVVVDTLESVHGLVIEAPREAYARLAGLDEVQWLEPALPAFSETNAANRVRTQADVAQSSPYGLDGSGVTVFVFDSGRAESHPDFQGRITYIDSASISTHATHVAGTVGSNGLHSGMAPGVDIVSGGFGTDGTGVFLYTNPGDIETDYASAIALGASISNNSIGTNTATNGFPCSITGDYGVTASVIDAVVRGSQGAPIIVFWANGNERQTDRCGQQYATTAPPGGAKNAISVGALNANNDTVTSFTSWGPTDDGRLKPEISAPGCQSDGDGGVTSTTLNGGYSSFCGTSMASPTAAGCAALLLQDWRAQFPEMEDPKNAMVKALFAHTAQDLLNPGPDYQTGYGSIRVVDAIDQMRSGRFVETSAEQGEAVRWTITVGAGETVKITAAWDDVPATPNTFRALVNDLDVLVTGPSGESYFPWTLAPDAPSLAATRDKANRLDNIEQVAFTAGDAGTYVVQVFGREVPAGPQSVSVVSSHALSPVVGLNIAEVVPALVPPGAPVDFTVSMTGDSIAPGSARLWWANGGGFSEVALSDLGGGQFGGALPGQFCTGSPVEFYFEAEGVTAGVVTQPAGGASAPFVAAVGEEVEVWFDDFTSDTGWSVGAPGDLATTGVWERAEPQATAAQPGAAFSLPTCWVTGASAGSGQGDFDVDGGATTLVSPVFDLSGTTDPVIVYQRWYSNTTGAAPGADTLRVELSNNGGSTWSLAESVGPSGRGTNGGWFESSVRVSDILTPTSQVRVRFVASDLGSGSIVEAAIDDVRIVDLVCGLSPPSCPADVTTEGEDNGVPDGLVSLSDFSYFLARWSTGDASSDITQEGACAIGTGGDGVTLSDFSCYLAAWSSGCP